MNRAIGVALGLAADRWLGEPPARGTPWPGSARSWARWSGWRGGTRGRRRVVRGGRGRWGVDRRRRAAPGRRSGAGRGRGDGRRRRRPHARRRGRGGRRLLADGRPRRRPPAAALARRPDDRRLDEPGVARAVVESIAENTTDAVVAPALWAAVGGAPAVLAYRAANTLDAMVGHRTERYERFGWASARLDDVLNVVPAHVGRRRRRAPPSDAMAGRRSGRPRSTPAATRRRTPVSSRARSPPSLGVAPRRRQPLRRPASRTVAASVTAPTRRRRHRPGHPAASRRHPSIVGAGILAVAALAIWDAPSPADIWRAGIPISSPCAPGSAPAQRGRGGGRGGGPSRRWRRSAT